MIERQVVRLKVTLDGVERPVVRQIEVPLALRLDRLHQTLQIAMGWMDSHLWGFEAGDASFGPPMPRGSSDGTTDATKRTLQDALQRAGDGRLFYTYDYGDAWQHIITVVAIASAEPGILYPRLIAATGACPPEDVGGAPGYEEFLDAIADPSHPAHAELLEWCGGRFDPDDVDVEVIEIGLRRVAKRWKQRPPVRVAKPK